MTIEQFKEQLSDDVEKLFDSRIEKKLDQLSTKRDLTNPNSLKNFAIVEVHANKYRFDDFNHDDQDLITEHIKSEVMAPETWLFVVNLRDFKGNLFYDYHNGMGWQKTHYDWLSYNDFKNFARGVDEKYFSIDKLRVSSLNNPHNLSLQDVATRDLENITDDEPEMDPKDLPSKHKQ